jgi:hypothetical protein
VATTEIASLLTELEARLEATMEARYEARLEQLSACIEALQSRVDLLERRAEEA